MPNTKTKFWRCFAIFSILSLVEYLIFHFQYLVTDRPLNEYSLMFLRLSLSVMPPLLCAMVLRLNSDFLTFVRDVSLVCLPRLVTSFLYSYIILVYTGSISTSEALAYSPISAVVIVVVYILLSILCYGLIHLLLFFMKKKQFPIHENLPKKSNALYNPVFLGIMIFPTLLFILELAAEIYSTILFFVDGAALGVGEIVWMVSSYLFILAKLAISACAVLFIPQFIDRENKNGKNEKETL